MSVSRRAFLVAVPVAGLALAARRSPRSPGDSESQAASAAGTSNAAPAPSVSTTPVVSFHLDQPYLDLTGLEKPYVPPAGLQSGAALAALSEQEVLSRFYGFI